MNSVVFLLQISLRGNKYTDILLKCEFVSYFFHEELVSSMFLLDWSLEAHENWSRLMADVVAHQQRNLTWVYIYLDFDSLKKNTTKPIDKGKSKDTTKKKKVAFTDQTNKKEIQHEEDSGCLMNEFTPRIDLVAEAKNHIAFLNEVDKHPMLHESQVILNAIRRYETMWLPLLAKYPEEDLEPPLDVHWIWHCHMLSPQAYRNDCHHHIQAFPDHRFRVLRQEKDGARTAAKALWETNYSGEPFHVNYETVPDNIMHDTKISYDLYAAAHRQRGFYYHVSLPHFYDSVFLKQALERYKKFIRLKRKNPGLFVVPMYDVDLIWHTHQLHPEAYYRDTMAYLHTHLNHDDTSTDRGPVSKLSVCDNMTRGMWYDTYKEQFPIPGTMNRGDNYSTRMTKMSTREVSSNVSKQCVLQITKVSVENFTLKPKQSIQGKITLHLLSGKKELWKLKPKRDSPIEWTNPTYGHILYFELDTKNDTTLKVTLTYDKNPLVSKKLVSAVFHPANDVEDIEVGVDSPEIRLSHITPEGVVLILEANLLNLEKKDEVFRLDVGSYETVKIPDNADSFWGTIPLPKQINGFQPIFCRMATHKLYNRRGRDVFTCRVIHSFPLRMSVIQILYREKVVALSHLIGSDSLPKPEQVGLPFRCVTLEQQKGERAMLIRNAKGDWGVIKAQWVFFRRGYIPDNDEGGKHKHRFKRARRQDKQKRNRGNKSQSGNGLNAEPDDFTPDMCALEEETVRGRPGHLAVSFFDLEKNRYDYCTVMESFKWSDARNKIFRIGDTEVDFMSSMFTVNANTKDIAENLALVFSVAVLFVVCEPKPSEVHPGCIIPKRKLQTVQKRGDYEVYTCEAEQLHTLQAVGYREEQVPTNNRIFWQVHENCHMENGHIDENLKNLPKEMIVSPLMRFVDEPERSQSLSEIPKQPPTSLIEHSQSADCVNQSDVKAKIGPFCRCNTIGIGDACFCPWNPNEGPDTDFESGVGKAICGGCGGCGANCGATLSDDEFGIARRRWRRRRRHGRLGLGSGCGAVAGSSCGAQCAAACGADIGIYIP